MFLVTSQWQQRYICRAHHICCAAPSRRVPSACCDLFSSVIVPIGGPRPDRVRVSRRPPPPPPRVPFSVLTARRRPRNRWHRLADGDGGGGAACRWRSCMGPSSCVELRQPTAPPHSQDVFADLPRQPRPVIAGGAWPVRHDRPVSADQWHTDANSALQMGAAHRPNGSGAGRQRTDPSTGLRRPGSR